MDVGFFVLTQINPNALWPAWFRPLNLSGSVDAVTWSLQKQIILGSMVLITASCTSSEPIHTAQICHQRGRIVLVGVTGSNCA